MTWLIWLAEKLVGAIWGQTLEQFRLGWKDWYLAYKAKQLGSEEERRRAAEGARELKRDMDEESNKPMSYEDYLEIVRKRARDGQ